MGAIIAGAAIAVVGGVMQDNSQKKAQKKASQDQANAAQRSSQWDAWAAERQRMWNLQDYERVQNYKEDSIRGFAQFAPTQALRDMQAPERTTVDTTGLADFNPNDLSLDMTKRNVRTTGPIPGSPGTGTESGVGRALSQLR